MKFLQGPGDAFGLKRKPPNSLSRPACITPNQEKIIAVKVKRLKETSHFIRLKED